MQDGGGSSSRGGDPDGALIRVGGGVAAAPARDVSLCGRRRGRGRRGGRGGRGGCGGQGSLWAAGGAAG